MKKLLLTIVGAFLFSVQMEAMSLVPLTVSIIDNKPVGHPTPKSPVEVPTVYIEDYVLTFTENHPDYTLYIKDEDGFVVYSTTVWSSDTEVILPSTLSGDYEIELVMGNWLFTGWIEL